MRVLTSAVEGQRRPFAAFMSQTLLGVPGCAARRVRAHTQRRAAFLLPAARGRRTVSSLCVCTLSVDRRRVLEERWSRQEARREGGTAELVTV
jgi:hypothetical protein